MLGIHVFVTVYWNFLFLCASFLVLVLSVNLCLSEMGSLMGSFLENFDGVLL